MTRAVFVPVLAIALVGPLSGAFAAAPSSAPTVAADVTRTSARDAVPIVRADATPGAKKESKQVQPPAPPRKTVEEPVFRMPELVIVGENQARIMAQKEQLAGTPMRGLHEAPLLEKEEGSVAALQQREPAPRTPPVDSRTAAVVKLSGGSHSWFGGAAWLGRQAPGKVLSLDLAGSSINGEPVGLGSAGGWDARAALSYARVFTRDEMKDREAAMPAWLKPLNPFGLSDDESMVAGWQGFSRDLTSAVAPATARRRLDRVWLGGDMVRGENGISKTVRTEFVRDRSPAGKGRGLFLGGGGELPVWDRGKVFVRVRPRIEIETARATGDHVLAGAAVEAAWIPSERWRYLIGFSAEGVYGDGLNAGSLRPIVGVSWTTATGPTLAASFAPRLNAAWYSEEAVRVPYSFFASGIVPERELANFSISVWQESWDESEGRVTWRIRESRNALAWSERAGEGLWEPAILAELTVQELTAGLKYRGFRPFTIYGSGTWRSIDPSAGRATGIPRGEGKFGLSWTWRGLTLGGEVEVVRARPRSAEDVSPDLAPYTDLGIEASYRPRSWIEVHVRVENLAGDTIEKWGGYPEPKRFVSAGAMIAF